MQLARANFGVGGACWGQAVLKQSALLTGESSRGYTNLA